ncbi:Lcl C-terminal domain-containing protein [Kaarinaea lacus]
MTQRYQVNNDGTVSDDKNNLMWMQCSVGQRWSNGQCLGTAQAMTWHRALQEANSFRLANYSNWRLPTIYELSRIAELRCQQPAINLALFPGTAPADYWTSTSFANDESLAWRMQFSFAENHTAKKSSSATVRLVRSINE